MLNIKIGANIFEVKEIRLETLETGKKQLQAITDDYEVVELSQPYKNAGEEQHAHFIVDRIAKKSNLFKVIDLDSINSEWVNAGKVQKK